jgi:hypothetical protein
MGTFRDAILALVVGVVIFAAIGMARHPGPTAPDNSSAPATQTPVAAHAGGILTAQKGDNYIWLQNHGDPVQILSVVANRGNCRGMLGTSNNSGIPPFILQFGEVQSMNFWASPDDFSAACHIIEFKVHMRDNDLVWTW